MQPLPGHLAMHSGVSGGAQAHVLYRRSVEDMQSWCGVKGNVLNEVLLGTNQICFKTAVL